jgi:sugar O-acyltransferase (sialic acid O-acetyltransferase NeuD family)
MKRLAIIGSGDLGQQIAYHANNDNKFEVVGFFDDFESPETSTSKILGTVERVEKVFKNGGFDVLIIAIGYKHFAVRETLFSRFKNIIPFATIIHSSCYVDVSCKIGEGVCLFPGSVLDANVEVKDNVLINVACTIAHDSIIGRNTFLSPRVAIAGFVTIGENCNIGINSTIIDNIKITNNSQIGGGAVVISNIEKHGLYVGNPSRFIR